ncbi:MAG: EAL domain-containing protein [Lachnospiraceae bacterium]|nr:EAL domain-containing protein [Lachnospiraceae bacterium]MBQ2320590.1 EAL domain-containing protein [Lachnospiraceae bacterium]
MDIKIQCCGFAILVFITYFCLRQKSIGTHSGNIEKIGERVFEKTCQFIVEKNIAQYGIEYIEINLSVKQCESPDFADKYIGIMEKYGVNLSLINLEVTETASLGQKEILINNMQKLIEYGVTFFCGFNGYIYLI